MQLNLQTREAGKRRRRVSDATVPQAWNGLLQPIREASAAANPSSEGIKDTSEAERIFFALAQAVEQRDLHTASHCERLAFIAVAMGIVSGLDRNELQVLYRGGYMHDIGKVGIPDSILFKPGKLTPQEWDVMETHTTRGVEICRHVKSLAPVLPIIRHHHERWDGSGYPDGLAGEEIPLLARLVQMGDIYDALTSPRPYKDPISPAKALRIIREETARGWRDPRVEGLFLKLHKDVISKADQFLMGSDRSLDAMRAALSRLQLRP
jgi:putative two-component system response regulator